MQPVVDPPRDSLTTSQVTDLIEATSLTFDVGLELYDADENLLEDISDDLQPGGYIERGNYRRLHGGCMLSLSRELQWGSARVKPYMTLSDGQTEARFNLGVYLLSTPGRQAGATPKTFEVEGFDKLLVLDTPYGSTYRVAAGTGYIAAVETLIAAAGESKVRIDQTSAATTLPTDRVWLLDEKNTYLTIINDLLAAVGYRGLWVDWDGYYRSEAYSSPAGRASEWTYNAGSDTTTLGEERLEEADYFAAPNRWVGVRDDPSQDLPAVSDGIYEVVNQSDGPTSVDARGRTITKVLRLDVADQTALGSRVDRTVETDKQLVRRFRDLAVGLNPLHWHFDVVQLVDTEVGVNGKYLVEAWQLPLDGDDMTLELRAV